MAKWWTLLGAMNSLYAISKMDYVWGGGGCWEHIKEYKLVVTFYRDQRNLIDLTLLNRAVPL